jgi:hypothetical protein
MRKKILNFLTVFCVAFAVLIMANSTDAQNRRVRGNVYSKQYVEQLLERIEERSDDFTKIFDEALDDSRLDTTRTEENYTDRARDLENATDELRREFDHDDTRGETRENVRKVLSAASVVNRIMASRNFGVAAETSWTRFRAELNTLARIYNMPGVGARTYGTAANVRVSPVRRGSAAAYNPQAVERLLERIEERTDAFTKTFDEALDDSRLNRTFTEERFTDRARDLENATDELRREFDHNDTLAENTPEARKVLRNATIVDRIMKRRNFGRLTESTWLQLRAEINALARIYRIPLVGAAVYR